MTLPLVMSPGVSTAVVLRNSVAGGVRAGLQTAAGANAASACYGVLAATGVSLALQRWPSAWAALRVAGTTYIAWLGVQSLCRAFDGGPRAGWAGGSAAGRAGIAHLYEGFVTNVLNPAVATFYFVVVPQFVPRNAPIMRTILALTAIHVGLAGSWHVAWAMAGGTLAHILSRRRPRQALETVAGLTLIALAMKLALG